MPESSDPDDGPYLNPFPGPPRLTLHEVNEVSADAYEVIYRYANQKGFTPNEVRNYYDLCISKGLTDRTLNISFMDVQDCTAELVEHLRRLLATEHSLWRVRICGTTAETTVVIYPYTVRYGSHPIDVDEVEALGDVLRREAEKRGRPAILDLQRAFLKRAIASAIASGPGEFPIVVAGFDNYNGDTTKTTLWTLCRNDIGDLEMLPPRSFMVGAKYHVKPDGDYGYHVGDDAPYWVREWIFPSDQPPPARLQFKAYDASYHPFSLELGAKPLEFLKHTSDY
ncbi:hypothetical protein [Tuwongella immobilis]|uniref:hypothetical protein n=1 Tax=Tuwongella immobilis TaxID=692036 RepID=UPI0013A70380|nr:hypothetical protein [Tuwongella immobilis]